MAKTGPSGSRPRSLRCAATVQRSQSNFRGPSCDHVATLDLLEAEPWPESSQMVQRIYYRVKLMRCCN